MLTLLPERAETPGELVEAADVRLALAVALTPIEGAGSPDVEASYRRAREVIERLDDPVRLFRALWGLWYVNFGRGRWGDARDLAGQLLTVAGRDNDQGRLLEAHHAFWPTLVGMGDALAALPHLEAGLALYDPERHGTQAWLYGGHDAGACCRYHLARARWVLGYPDQAAAAMRDALRLADRLAHPMTQVIALTTGAVLSYQLGADEASREYSERAVGIAQAYSFRVWLDDCLFGLACVEARQGDVRRAVELLERLGPSVPGSTATRVVVNFVLLAGALCEVGEVERGLVALDTIPPEFRTGGLAADIDRIRGDLLLLRGERNAAEACLRRALGLAQHRSEKTLELRAALSLARLWQREDRREQARRLVADVYGWFSEGFDTVDLRAARKLLDEG